MRSHGYTLPLTPSPLLASVGPTRDTRRTASRNRTFRARFCGTFWRKFLLKRERRWRQLRAGGRGCGANDSMLSRGAVFGEATAGAVGQKRGERGAHCPGVIYPGHRYHAEYVTRFQLRARKSCFSGGKTQSKNNTIYIP